MKAASVFQTITPKNEFYLVGYFDDIRKLPALGVHDEPYVNLMLLKDGDCSLLFVAIDVCIVSKEKIEPVKRRLSEKLGIPYDRITVNSIHSHSCANGFDTELPAPKDNPEYVDYVGETIIRAALTLPDKLTEVRAEYLKTNVRGWYSNRNDKTKPFDDEAVLLRFPDSSGRAAGAFLNFNCHATVVGPQNRYLTTDVIGEVRRNLTDFAGIMPYTFTGASGDLGNRQFRRGHGFEELSRVGAGISGEIKKGAFRPISMEGFHLKFFDYHVRYDNTKYFEEYRASLEQVRRALASGKLTADQTKNRLAEEEQLKGKLTVEQVDFHIVCKIITLGGVQIVTFPGELASIFGMRIKQSSKAALPLVLGYADGYHGYFVPESDYGTTYESLVSRMPKGETEKMIDELRNCL